MDLQRNLLFGVLALQADFIDAQQFAEVCTLWSASKNSSLADLLVERGWLTYTDRADIERLLERKLKKHNDDSRASLAAVADAEVRRVLNALGDSEVDRSLATPPPPDYGHLPSTVPPDQVMFSRYTLTRLHATGGLGQVWLARDGNLARDVALKELRPETSVQPTLKARFLEEARITGQLEHPGIVPVYELVPGLELRPSYYVMRFVRGRTLTDAARAYHQRRAEGRTDPLELAVLLNALVSVCNTVAYAHARGVIHRDLKGQNVILGDFGEVIVLDWGLAKVLGSTDPDSTLPPVTMSPWDSTRDPTLAGQVMGTPAYMAPEQAEGRLDQIDCQTDVYGLGAMLYEILTGQPPFSGADAPETLRKVREEEPARPRHLTVSVPPALEAIALRALAKRPAERYESATELAQETQRWLADEPVQAYPEPLLPRLGRWARRHRSFVTGAAALLITVVSALSVSTLLIAREQAETEHQRQQAQQNFETAEKQRAQAEAEFHRASRAVDSLTQVAVTGLARTPRLQASRKQELDQALRTVIEIHRQFLQERSTSPEVSENAARALALNAGACHLLGKEGEAEVSYREAILLLEQLRKDYPSQPERWERLGLVYRGLGEALQAQGKLAEAIRQYDEALVILENLRVLQPKTDVHRTDITDTHYHQGLALVATDRDAEAQTAFRKSAALATEMVAQFPENAKFPFLQARSQNDLGALLAKGAVLTEAKEQVRTAIQLLEDLKVKHPFETDHDRVRGQAYHNQAVLLFKTGEPQEAEALFQKAIALLTQVVEEFPQVPQDKFVLATTRLNFASLLQQAGGRREEADKELRKALALLDQASAAAPGYLAYRERAAYGRYQLALLGIPLDLKQTEQELQKAREQLENLPQEELTASGLQTLANVYYSQGVCFVQTRRLKEAEPAYRRAVEAGVRLTNRYPRPVYWFELGRSLTNLGILLGAEGALAKGEESLDQAVAAFGKAIAGDPSANHRASTAFACYHLASLRFAQKKYPEARKALEEGIAHRKAALDLERKNPAHRTELGQLYQALTRTTLEIRDHIAASQAAAEWSSLNLDSSVTLYETAGVLASCIPLAENDSQLSADKKKELTRAYGDRAVELLRRAIEKGYRKPLDKDPTLAPLRSREDFQRLLEQVPKGE